MRTNLTTVLVNTAAEYVSVDNEIIRLKKQLASLEAKKLSLYKKLYKTFQRDNGITITKEMQDQVDSLVLGH